MFTSLFSLHSAGHFSYVGLFLLLGGSGFLAPVPEELTLITAGYLAYKGIMTPWIAIPVAILAVLIADSVLFFLAKKGAPHAQKLLQSTLFKKLENTWILSPEYPLRPVFVFRPFSGLRLTSPVFAAIHGVTWYRFLCADVLALSIHLSLLFSIGYYFHSSRHYLGRVIETIQHDVLYGLGASIFIFLLYTLLKNRFMRNKRQKPEEGSGFT
jgi:membrane-associated protein